VSGVFASLRSAEFCQVWVTHFVFEILVTLGGTVVGRSEGFERVVVGAFEVPSPEEILEMRQNGIP
jgi:hypothetical protein